MSDVTIVSIIIFIFTFVPLILAEFARTRSLPSIEDFFVCNRNMSSFLYFFTVYATWYSTFAVMGAGAHFYMYGPVFMTAFAWNSLFGVLLFFVGRRLWFYARMNNYLTPSDFFDDIYGSKALTSLITGILIVFTLPYVQIQFTGGASLIDIASEGKIPWQAAGLIFYAVMVVYLWAGGLRAVAMADVFFGTIIFVTLLGMGFFLAEKAGGTVNIFDVLMEQSPEELVIDSSDGYDHIAIWISMFVIVPVGALMSPPIWIRNYSVKKYRTFYLIPFLITVVTIGYLGAIIGGNACKVLKPEVTDPNVLLPAMISEYGGHILIALFFCGFAAASLSTANSQIHALSDVYTVDIHKRYIDRKADGFKLFRIAKWAVMLISVLTYLIMISAPSIILNTGILALSGTAQIFIPTIGALFWKKSNAKGAIVGILSGISVLFIMYFGLNLEACTCGICGLFANALIFAIVSRFTVADNETRRKITDYRRAFDRQKLK